MTIVRNTVFAGVIVSLAALAACQSAGPGGSRHGAERRRRRVDEFRRRRRLDASRAASSPRRAVDTGNKLAEGSYIVGGEHRADHRHLGDPPVSDQLQLPAGLAEAAELHSSAGQKFTLIRRA